MKDLFDRWIPPYVRRPLIFLFIGNTAAYNLPRLVFFIFGYLWGPFDMTTGFDRSIPFVPASVWIYFLCYSFWATFYILSARPDKKTTYRFCAAELTAKTVCFLFFVFLPTVRVRVDLPSDMTFMTGFLSRFLYWVDAPNNLFPSIHILNSWFCFIGVRKNKNLPLWVKLFALIFNIAVAVSVLTTSQHVFTDIIPAILLAEGASFASEKLPVMTKISEKFFTAVDSCYEKCLVKLKIKK